MKRILALIITSPVWILGIIIAAPIMLGLYGAQKVVEVMGYAFTGKWESY